VDLRGAMGEAKGFWMFEIVAVVFVIGCAVALVGWWNGPDVPRA
jgi:hypothetical protein